MENAEPRFRRVARFVSPADRGFAAVVYGGSILFALLIVGLFVELVLGSWPSIVAFGPSFIWKSAWDPIASKFGALPMIYGTVVTSFIAIVLAAFVGIMAAVFLADFAPRWLATPLSFLIELLAAVPSVVYGLWGLFVLAPFVRTAIGPVLQKVLGWTPLFSGPIYGVGLLTAGIILALMIVPTVTAISRDVIAAIPRDLREASMALGTTKWETATQRRVAGGARRHLRCLRSRARPRARRNDRRDDGDRKSARDLGVALRAVVHARKRDRQRVHGGDDEHLHQRAHRAGLDSLRRQHRRQRAGAADDLERARLRRQLRRWFRATH